MKMHRYAVLLNTLMMVAPLVILDCHAQQAATTINTTNVSEYPPISMGKPMTLTEVLSAIHNTAGTTFNVEACAYNKSFSAITKIYIASAHTLPEFLDMITQAAGLKWRTGDHGVVMLYRQGEPEPSNLSDVAKAN